MKECALLLLLLGAAASAGLSPPQNLTLQTLNTQYVLHWDWPFQSSMNQSVSFTTQFISEFRSRRAAHRQNWQTVCADVVEQRCDFTHAGLFYFGIYLLRVRANTSQQASDWSQISFCPDKQAALGPPSIVKLSSVQEHLELVIAHPLSSTNESMKTLVTDLYYLIQYWRRSDGTQVSAQHTHCLKAGTRSPLASSAPTLIKHTQGSSSGFQGHLIIHMQSPANLTEDKEVVVLSNLDRWTWYCLRVQSRYDFENKRSVFSDTHCIQTKGQTVYWHIFLYFLLSLVLCFLLVLLLFFGSYKAYDTLKSIFHPNIQLPAHIQELWLSDAEKPQLLAHGSHESVCEQLNFAKIEADIQSSLLDDRDSSRHCSGDSGVYSTEDDHSALESSSVQSSHTSSSTHMLTD